MLDNQLRYQIWSDERLRDWSWDPLVYTQLAGQSLYGLLARDYAPLPQRLSAAAARLEKLPRLLEQMRANLDPARVPAIHAETAVKQSPGVLSLIDELIVPQLGTLSEADQARLRRAIEGARAAVQAHQKWLESELKPAARGRVPHRRRALRPEARLCARLAALARRDPSPRRRGGEGHTRRDVRAWRAPCSPGARRAPPTARRADERPTAGRHRRRARARVRRTAGARRRRRGSARDGDGDHGVRPRARFRQRAVGAARDHPDA